MGGNAFNQTRPNASFPRMPPTVYQALKSYLQPLMESLYDLVAVPCEAPEKDDHGDIDFIVARPRPGTSPEIVQKTLRATYSLPQEGNRTSNYAVPVDVFPNDLQKAHESVMAFYQIDVNVCADEAEWERTVFMHSYGDLGMILGVLARGIGLSLSVYGLKLLAPLPTNPPVPFHLSSSLSDILTFFGLSQSRWKEGFATQHEVFDWVAVSPLFDAQKIVPSDRGHSRGKKGRGSRSMYQNFLEYAQERALAASDIPGNQVTTPRVSQDDALRFFGKEAEHAALLHASKVKQHTREVFTGKIIEEYSGMRGLPVKWLMDTTRERLVEKYVQECGSLPSRAETPTNALDQSETKGHNGLLDSFVLLPWELALAEMSVSDVRSFVQEVKSDMEVAGTFEQNWERENARKAEKRKVQGI